MEANAELALLKYRADQADSRMERMEGKLDRVLDGLMDVKVSLAAVPTREDMRNWSLWTIGTVVASMLALVAIYLTASGNLLAAFKTGIQHAQSGSSPAPIVIQVPAPAPARP